LGLPKRTIPAKGWFFVLGILTQTLIFEVKTGGAVTLESDFRFTAHPKNRWVGIKAKNRWEEYLDYCFLPF
jgi:hypothetical protein